MSQPTPHFAAPQSPAPAEPPNYWAGLLLNIFLPGAGFTLLGLWQKHVAWALGFVLGYAISFGLILTIGGMWNMFTTVVLLAWMLVSYHQTYQQLAGSNAWPSITSNLRVGMILGHIVLGVVGFTVFGILAAVLIPNMLEARERALEPQYAQAIYEQVQTAGMPAEMPAYCPPLEASNDSDLQFVAENVAACTILPDGEGGFQVQVEFDSGRSFSAHK